MISLCHLILNTIFINWIHAPKYWNPNTESQILNPKDWPSSEISLQDSSQILSSWFEFMLINTESQILNPKYWPSSEISLHISSQILSSWFEFMLINTESQIQNPKYRISNPESQILILFGDRSTQYWINPMNLFGVVFPKLWSHKLLASVTFIDLVSQCFSDLFVDSAENG